MTQGVNIVGKCGHSSPADGWLLDAVRRPLPRDTFRCPDCGYTFRREHVPGKIELDHLGFPVIEPWGVRGYVRVVHVE